MLVNNSARFSQHMRIILSMRLIRKDFRSVARKEIRDWIRKGLLVERGGLLLATDALQKAFRFVESIENLEP